MLTAEENEVLRRAGPGTAMGAVLRRYWTPAFQLADLPAPDCPPVRVTILGENFVAFRDTNGQLGFLDGSSTGPTRYARPAASAGSISGRRAPSRASRRPQGGRHPVQRPP